MDRMARYSHANRGLFQQFDLRCLPYRRRQIEAHNLFFFASPETGHQQNAPANASFAKRNGLIERGHPKPAGAFFIERARAFDRPMPVAIGLDDSANGYTRSEMLLYGAKILAQRTQRNVRPCGTSRNALGKFDGSHFARL